MWSLASSFCSSDDYLWLSAGYASASQSDSEWLRDNFCLSSLKFPSDNLVVPGFLSEGHALILKSFLGGLGSLPLQFHLWLLFPCLVARRALHRPLSSSSLDERSRLSSPPDCLLGVTTFLKLASPMIILSKALSSQVDLSLFIPSTARVGVQPRIPTLHFSPASLCCPTH